MLPRLKELGLAEAVAAVDINPEALALAKDQLGLDESKLYASAEQAFAENKADFVNIVVPPAFHEQMVDLAVAQRLPYSLREADRGHDGRLLPDLSRRSRPRTSRWRSR